MTIGLILMGVILLAGGLTLLGLWGYPKLTYKIEYHKSWKQRALDECGCRIPSRGEGYSNIKNRSTLICYDCGRYWMARNHGYGASWNRAPWWKKFQMRRDWDRADLRMKTTPIPVERTYKEVLADDARSNIDRLLHRNLNGKTRTSSRRI